MTEWTTISVTEERKEELDERLPEGRSWDERFYKAIAGGPLSHNETNEPPNETNELVAQLREEVRDAVAEGLQGQQYVNLTTDERERIAKRVTEELQS